MNKIGGVTKDINEENKNILINQLTDIKKDFSEIIYIANNSVSLMGRLSGTGVLTTSIAQDYGLTGIAAKAVGISNDVRADIPYAMYGELFGKNIPTESG